MAERQTFIRSLCWIYVELVAIMMATVAYGGVTANWCKDNGGNENWCWKEIYRVLLSVSDSLCVCVRACMYGM